ncbi:MAG: hypothetical protein LIP02_04975 [Bacteroidales bacterium]|nr:hypothetical protein [Bacteroidales bacterium]
MKKSFILAAGLLLLASCSNDDFDGMATGGDATVTISASLPSDISSRAYSDGLTAEHLDYAVYESGADTPIIEGTGTFDNRSTTLTLQLVTGKSYEVIFWAQKKGAPYTWNSATKTVTVDYTDAALNDEDRDAFYSVESFTVEGATTITSTLKRPFAQINVGTNDINQAGLADKYISATMSVKDVYSAFNLSTGKVDDSTKGDVEFTETLRPNQGLATTDASYEKFPVGDKAGDYEYLAMAYVLVGADKQTSDIELAFYDSGDKFHELSVPGAPIQRNYRTNIFGALLTSTVDFTININPYYETDDQYNLNIVWDGTTTSAPKQNADGAWLITTAAELAYVAQQVNSGATTYIDETLLLCNDLDLGNQPWTPIGGHEKYFKGMFNGQDHTISNLYIKKNDGSDAALFGHIEYSHYKVGDAYNPPIVKNLKVDNVYIDARVSSWSTDNANNWSTGSGSAAAIVAKASEYTFIENCHVTNAIIYANHYAGAIGGQIKSGVKNCSANNITVTVVPGLDPKGEQDFGDKAGALVGQLAGTAYYAEVTGNTASNFTITGYRDLGGAFGYAHISFDQTGGKNGKITGNTVSNGSVNQSYEGYYEATNTTVEAFCGRHDGFSIDGSNTDTDVEVNLVAANNTALAQAIANAPAGSTITLGANISESGITNLATITDGMDITIDLNGYTLDYELADPTTGSTQIFTVKPGATLTITGNGKVNVTCGKSANLVSAFINSGGTVNIEGGTYVLTAGTYYDGYLMPCFVDVNSTNGDATLNISGGSFDFFRNGFRIFANSQKNKNTVGTINITGGTFTNLAIWDHITAKDTVANQASCDAVNITGGTFTNCRFSWDADDATLVSNNYQITGGKFFDCKVQSRKIVIADGISGIAEDFED